MQTAYFSRTRSKSLTDRGYNHSLPMAGWEFGRHGFQAPSWMDAMMEVCTHRGGMVEFRIHHAESMVET